MKKKEHTKQTSEKGTVRKGLGVDFKIKKEFDLSPLYKSIDDPQIDKDLAAIEKHYADFAAKYSKDGAYLSNDAKLLGAIEDYSALMEKIAGAKPYIYMYLMKDLDSTNDKIQAKDAQINERLLKAGNQVLFFDLAISKLDAKRQQELFKNPKFSRHQYFLKKIFNKAKYRLSEAEEKIISLKSETSQRMWVDAQQKLAASKRVKYKGKELSLTEALLLRKKLPQKERYKLHDLIIAQFKEVAFMAEAEFNAVFNDKKVDDELRGAKQPYEITVAEYENDIKTVENLIETVTNNAKIAHDFYKAKAAVMGLKKLRPADLTITLARKQKKITFEEAVAVVHEAFATAGSEFSDFLKEMVEKGQIDVYPKKGKRGGAYCINTSKQLPVYIFMNFDDTMDGASTLAHEMGHAIHSKLSFSQPELYTMYPISIAEVASTFFEHIVFHHTLEGMNEEDRAIALLNNIEDNIGTIFRQVQFFNFEKDMHAAIRAKGTISAKEMAAFYVKHHKFMTGPVLEMTEDDGYYFSYIPHFRYFFYVYSYAYGQIISRALYANFKKDPSFIEKVKQFLSTGGSKSPYEIFKSIGIDTSNPEFFESGIMQIKADLDTAIKLAKKVGLIKKQSAK